MTQDRDPKVSYRMPEGRLEAIDALAEQHGVARSALLRRFDAYGLESNAEALGVEAEIANLRQEIIDFGKPIDDAGGFAGRVRDDFERRFKSGYDPKWLAAKAESYRREARMLEEKVAEHPDAPPVEEGELEAEVDRVLRETLEAAQLSDWSDRYSNPFEKFAGVESGRQSRRMALALTRTAMKMEQDLSHFRDPIVADRRVRGDDLPEMGAEELPPNVEADDVASVARELCDRGLSPEDVALDPTEFDPFGWVADEGEERVSVEGNAGSELPDGGSEAVADGGDNEAIQVYANQNDDQDGEDVRGVSDLVEWAAKKFRDADPGETYGDERDVKKREKARETAEDEIRTRAQSDRTTWQAEIMDQNDLTPDELIALADEYNDERTAALAGDRDNAPQAVATANGGVRLE